MTPKEKKQRQALLTLAHQDFAKGLNTHAFFKTNDHKVGEDLVQDTFLKTWKYLAKGGKIELMKAFLYHILNKLIIDQYRKRKTVSLDVLVEKGFEPSVDDFAKIFNMMDGKVLLLLISELPPTYKNIIKMRYIEDLSLQEISDRTGQSKNTVAVQVHRAIIKLKEIYSLRSK